MATSGQVKTYEVDGGTYFYVDWQQTSQSESGNYTNINWQLNIHCRWNYYSNAIRSNGVSINGSSVYGGGTFSNINQGNYRLASGSLRINHNNDGTKTFNISTSGWVIDGGDTSGSQNFTLNKINRYATTNSVTGSDIENNFSVNYSKYVNDYKYKLRISYPGIRPIETIDDYVSDTSFALSSATIEDIYNTYPNTNTFDLGFAIETWDSAGTTKLSAGNEKVINCTKVDRIARLYVNNEFKRAVPYVWVTNEWKKAIPYVWSNNEWKRGR